jgi:hypothetical protein
VVATKNTQQKARVKTKNADGLPTDDYVRSRVQYQGLPSEEKAFKYVLNNLQAVTPPTKCMNLIQKVKKKKKVSCNGDLDEDRKMSTPGNYRFGYRCKNKACKSFYSFWKGTLFDGTHLPAADIVMGILQALRKGANHQYFEGSTNLGHATATLFFEKVNFVMLNYYRKLKQSDKMVGGNMVKVQIDESKFGKNKYGAGRPIAGCWVLGGIDDKGKRFAVPVPKRDEDTLFPILLRFIKPGSIIVSDYWGAYKTETLEANSFYHIKVNHSVGWKEVNRHWHLGEIVACTNTIEGMWNGIKVHCPTQHMTSFDMEMELAVYWFRSTHKGHIWAAFWYAFQLTSKEEFISFEQEKQQNKERFRNDGEQPGRPMYTRAEQTRDHRAGAYHHETCACIHCTHYWANLIDLQIEEAQKEMAEMAEKEEDQLLDEMFDIENSNQEYDKYIAELTRMGDLRSKNQAQQSILQQSQERKDRSMLKREGEGKNKTNSSGLKKPLDGDFVMRGSEARFLQSKNKM